MVVDREVSHSIGDLAAMLDAERFVGRHRELAVVEAALAGDSPIRLVHIHGPAGIGKSALLRAAARLGRHAGRPLVVIDGRSDIADAQSIAAALAPAMTADRPLIVIDEFDRLVALRRHIGELILDRMPASTVVIFAGRQKPPREQFGAGLEHISIDIELGPLSTVEARDLLERRSVGQSEQMDQIVSWSAGYPLALSLAAEMSSQPMPTATDGALQPNRLADLVLERLAAGELDSVDPRTLEIASIAPMVDGRLLTAALPGRPTRLAFQRLRESSVAESVGHRIALHRLVRDAVKTRFRVSEPDRYRQSVLRVADHLRGRIIGGESEVLFELADLVENPNTRIGFGPSTTHYADGLGAGDLEIVAATLGCAQTQWWARVVRWAGSRPEQILTVRRSSGELSLLAICGRFEQAPPWAGHEIEFGPVLAEVRRRGITGDSLFLIDIHFVEADLDEATRAEIVRVGNIGVTRRVRGSLLRHCFANFEDRPLEEGSRELGFVEVPQLRRVDDERSIETWTADYGAGGLTGGLWALIRAEQGESPIEPLTATGVGEQVIAALRRYRDDAALEASSLGGGVGAERVAAVRAVVASAVDDAFGEGRRDVLLRELIWWSYLDPDGGLDIAMERASMSRSSFYRHLREARDRVSAVERPR